MEKIDIASEFDAIDLILNGTSCIVSNLAFQMCRREEVSDAMRADTVSAIVLLKNVLDGTIEGLYADVAEEGAEKCAKDLEAVDRQTELERIVRRIIMER